MPRVVRERQRRTALGSGRSGSKGFLGWAAGVAAAVSSGMGWFLSSLVSELARQFVFFPVRGVGGVFENAAVSGCLQTRQQGRVVGDQ